MRKLLLRTACRQQFPHDRGLQGAPDNAHIAGFGTVSQRAQPAKLLRNRCPLTMSQLIRR